MKQGDRYSNTETTAAFLSGGRGHDLQPMLRFFDRISYPKWQALGDAVRSGRGQTNFDRFTEEEQQIFSAGVQSFSAQKAAALAASYDFGQRLLLVDLWTDSTHTQPPAAALMSGEFLIIAGEGQTCSEKEAQGWLRQTPAGASSNANL